MNATTNSDTGRPDLGARTLFDKLWDAHVVDELGEGAALLHVDRILLHDLSGARSMMEIRDRQLDVSHPELVFATPDHAVSSAPGRGESSGPQGRLVKALREECARHGIRHFDVNAPEQGIVHVIGPELGITLPGVTLVCGDSHTCTHGGLGALAWGIGSSELTHALVTQTTVQKRPGTMRVRFDGNRSTGVEPKDMILHLIGRVGAAGGSGFALEYAGEAIRALSVESRMTICNLSIELGARMGMVAPDDTTLEYIAKRPMAPAGESWDRAVDYWRTLRSDDAAAFDRELSVDVGAIAPQITWGTSPQDVVAVDDRVPDPGLEPDPERRAAMEAAIEYMGLVPNAPIAGTPIDWVFIGSCTNARLGDLREAAAIVRGRKVAKGVNAWVVPGSQQVKRASEAEGLDRVFMAAGFQWREPGCSMCVAANEERVPPGSRSVSTSNRNFVGRQGPGARTHLASPKTAAAAAVAGCITDFRALDG